MAWFEGNSNKRTRPARSKRPNALGLYDMRGNAREWCSDWYQRGYYASSILLDIFLDTEYAEKAQSHTET